MFNVFLAKRREPRVKLNTHVTVSGRDAYGETFSCETVTMDVSPHGASLTIDRTVRCGTVVDFRTRDYEFRSRAIVRTVDMNRETGASTVGIEYLDEATNPVVIWSLPTVSSVER